MKVEFLEKERPVFTRALVEPWRLLALLVVSRIRRAFGLPRPERNLQRAALLPARIRHDSQFPSIF